MVDNSLELASWASGGMLLACDEAGYGCIAGSMFVAGVIFPQHFNFSLLHGLNDSKKLTEKKRFQLEPLILQHAAWSFCKDISAAEIDAGSPYYLRFEAAEAEVSAYPLIAQLDVIMDGNIPLKLPQSRTSSYLIKGDSKCLSIAAASVLAKCAKDRQMIELDTDCPAYGWVSNKGYESEGHREAIRKFGLTKHHRKSYCKKYLGATCI